MVAAHPDSTVAARMTNNAHLTAKQHSLQPSLFAAIDSLQPGYDEAFTAAASPRPHWQQLIAAFEAAGRDQLEQQQRRAGRMRHEDGATFNPFADPNGRTSAWSLDLFPFPLNADDWNRIKTGVKQRASLLEQILADVYGQQTLLKNGQIPAELIYANPHFLRPCHGIIPAGGRFLSFYAVDLYRDTDGSFRIYRDYGSQPAGLGYALENRIVSSRVFSELYHATNIRRLAPFFQTMHRAILERNALVHKDPGIVLLSPGPESPTYFEHAFLSRYLGYPLVEGQDLTVRNGQVFLKKLAGLEPVEAIFRQIADSVSDPFALRRQSIDGVAGLVQAAREGSIDIINPLGSGFIDTPILTGFLPGLCRLLRGEELLLQGRRLWWGGNESEQEYLLAHLSTLRIEQAMDRSAELPASSDLAAALANTPHSFMAGATITPSLVPTWNNGQIKPQPALLRVFACATPDGFAVMPGGLAMSAENIETLLSPSPTLQQSKDVWVLSDQPVEHFSMLDSLQSTAEFSRSSDLPSRVADNLLWLGRYLERAEGRIRLLRAIFRRLSGEAGLEDIPELPFLLKLLPTSPILSADGSQRGVTLRYQELTSSLHYALYNRENQDSVVAILWKVQEAARNVRDRLSLDCWRVINHLEYFLGSPVDDPLELLDDTLYNLSAFSGLAMESMTRGLGWRFMDMGRRLERGMFQTAILRSGLPAVCDRPRNTLEALLEIGDSIMTYRARYRTIYQLAPVLDLLIVDESNPKSLAFQFSQLAAHVEHLPRQHERRYSSLEERLALEMLTAARLLDLRDISCSSGNHTPLASFLESMEGLLLDFAQQITAHYLSRVPATPHFSTHYGKGEE